MGKQEKKRARLEQKKALYEVALLKIADVRCAHEDAKGAGSILNPPCTPCVAYCAINPGKAQKVVEQALVTVERQRAYEDLTGDKKAGSR